MNWGFGYKLSLILIGSVLLCLVVFLTIDDDDKENEQSSSFEVSNSQCGDQVGTEREECIASEVEYLRSEFNAMSTDGIQLSEELVREKRDPEELVLDADIDAAIVHSRTKTIPKMEYNVKAVGSSEAN